MPPLLPPRDCPDMTVLRGQIDALDRQLVQMLKTRSGYIDRAIELKTENGWPARIPSRVEEVVERVRQAAQECDLDPKLIESLWRELIDWSIAREAEVIAAD